MPISTKCPVCGKKFPNLDCLILHAITEHGYHSKLAQKQM